MELAGLAVQPEAVPIEHAIGGVRILLDLEDDEAAAQGMDAAARQQQSITRLDAKAVETLGHGAGLEFPLEIRPGHAPLQTGV